MENYSGNKQLTTQDVINAPEIVWLGIDFTQAKFIGPSGFVEINKIINVSLAAINDLFVAEPQKFNFPKLTGKMATSLLNMVYERNVKISSEGIIRVDDNYTIDEQVVKKIVSEYNFPSDNRPGLLFVVESLNKNKKTANTWVTFVDMKNREVIVTRKFAAPAMGFTFRNYWANAFLGILKLMPGYLRSLR